jgi:hypothetical protein
MIFVASPYSHPDPAIRHERFIGALRYANDLIREGEIVFSAIAYGHPFACYVAAPTDFASWRGLNHHMIALSTKVHVLMLNGWDESAGVQDEILYANEIDKPVVFVEID